MRLECRGKKSILVRTGYGAETEREAPEQLSRAAVVADLNAAAELILNNFFSGKRTAEG